MSDLALFERNFIERTYPNIVSDMSIAFAELVANSWDAGATRVDITIPQKQGQQIIIEDNGSGMTDEEFRSRWMVIAYNRVDHQGEHIDFLAADNTKIRRIAYVIGDSVDSSTSIHKTQEDFGEVFAYTYDQLVRTAEKRLFHLKAKLEEHYNQFNSEDYVNTILNEPEQLRLNNL